LEFNVPFQHKYGYIRDESGKVIVRETSCTGNVCPGKWLSGKRL